jgi:hypothetical protein
MKHQIFSDPLDLYPPSVLDPASLKALKTQTNSENGFRRTYGFTLYEKIENRKSVCHAGRGEVCPQPG